MVKVAAGSWANSIGFELNRNVQVFVEGNGAMLKVPCDTCSVEYELHYSKRFPPDVIRRKMQAAGWKVGHRMVCSHCVKTRPGAQKSTKLVPFKQPAPEITPLQALPVPEVLDPVKKALDQMANPHNKAVGSLAELDQLLAPVPKAGPLPVQTPKAPAPLPAPAAPAKAATPPAEPAKPAAEPASAPQPDRKAHITMMKLLDEFFGDSKGVYRSGADGKPYSDARVAKESGAPLAHVQAEREKWFGPLRGTEDLTEVKEELADLRARVENIITQANQQAERVRQEFTSKVDTARQQCETQVETLMKFARNAVQDLLESTEVLASEIDELLQEYKS